MFWTDESKFEIFSSKRKKYVRRSVGEMFKKACFIPIVERGGGSIMVWDVSVDLEQVIFID